MELTVPPFEGPTARVRAAVLEQAERVGAPREVAGVTVTFAD